MGSAWTLQSSTASSTRSYRPNVTASASAWSTRRPLSRTTAVASSWRRCVLTGRERRSGCRWTGADVADILVIDDDQAIATAFQHFLAYEGHHCRLASSAQDGIRLVDERRPDLVIMDV